ncbi:hypothetical protein DPMN_037493 [Dreissena polymorpha]|uniref:Uncharacterized protein n=1 Tax=Dreissena polymorpha TaxID=45954 RepID=A0A9D4MDJ3_DREPO|nr:hypothetical protein DPMN_037493 [Dreissena polymorpha]
MAIWETIPVHSIKTKNTHTQGGALCRSGYRNLVKRPVGPLTHCKSTQDDPSRPKSTQDNPSRPESTQVDPSRPKSTQVDPSRPKSTQVNPSQPESTQVNPSRPKSTQVIKAIQVAQGIRNRLV